MDIAKQNNAKLGDKQANLTIESTKLLQKTATIIRNNQLIAQKNETGGAKGPEPTRYGDWQHKGRVSDF